jgi:NAD(P)-dependent dehydrogenase (short-subunit alcohol dehydrogenase family)
MNQLFKGKAAIVTGASAGLGAATALQFACEGARAVVAARRQDAGEAVVRRIESFGGEGLFVRADVTHNLEVVSLRARPLDRFAWLDCSVNNAGISGPVNVPMADIDEARLDAVISDRCDAAKPY